MAEPNEVYGPLFHEGRIERAVIAVLRKWLPTYVTEACRQEEYGEIAAIKSWGVVSEFDRFPEQGLPALIVMCAGTQGEPEKEGGGYYRATYPLSVLVELAAARGGEARLAAQLYGAAVMGALLQRRSLGDDLQVTDWLGVSNGTVAVDQKLRRTRVAVEQMFAVRRSKIVTTHGGPATDEPPVPPFDEWPEITEADVTVTHMPSGDAS